MKLFLSSQGIPEHFRADFLKLFNKPAEQIRLACVVDASEVYSEEEKRPWFYEANADVEWLGVQLHEIRLLDYVGQQESLMKILGQFDGVWVVGGNTHYVRYAMKVSGFDVMIHELLGQDFVYAGYSAGAMVAGITIRYTDLDGEEHKEPERVDEGMGLVDLIIIPHWDQQDRAEYLSAMETAYQRDGLKISPLSDDQVIVVDD